MATKELFIGVMGGSSVDALDLALMDFSEGAMLVASKEFPIPASLRDKILHITRPRPENSYQMDKIPSVLEVLGEVVAIQVEISDYYAQCIHQFIVHENLDSAAIKAAGLHGQTLLHQPNSKAPYSWQLINGAQVAIKTGLPVVTDFRNADIAAGGQGAPLAPAFHDKLLRSGEENRVVINLGGIANVTWLPKDLQQPVIGFDTGPANCLLDANFQRYHPQSACGFDKDGKFAGQGNPNQRLLQRLLKDPFFKLPPPKSTGTDYFNLRWLQRYVDELDAIISPADLQATLISLTVESLARSIEALPDTAERIILCGGGQHNAQLTDQFRQRLSVPLQASTELGVDGDALEAMLMAWLAKMRLDELPANLPEVTGANRPVILGGLYLP